METVQIDIVHIIVQMILCVLTTSLFVRLFVFPSMIVARPSGVTTAFYNKFNNFPWLVFFQWLPKVHPCCFEGPIALKHFDAQNQNQPILSIFFFVCLTRNASCNS